MDNNRRSMEKIASSKAQNYKYNQIFGYKGPGEKILEEDIISVIKYDQTGRYLALGDNAGRVIVFQNENNKQKDEQLEYFTEFQSHTKEFDPLRSMEIEEGITGLSWLSPQGKYLKLISTNTRNIKLWKLYEKV
jgi:serine/threonine-protein phosphatase 2A regulatory subunit B